MIEIDVKKIERITKALYEAMKGLGTDEDTIVNEITNCTYLERVQVKNKYMTFYGKSLEDDFKSDLSGNFLKTVLALFKDPYEYQAEWLHKATDGVGTNERVLIELICTKDAFEIKKLGEAYYNKYHKYLDSVIVEELSGHLERILRSIVNGGRSENHGYDPEDVKKEAEELYKSGENRFGTGESDFIRLMCSSSFSQLNAIFSVYKEIYKRDFGLVLKDEFNGDVHFALFTIYACAVNKPLYFAKLIKETMIGIGTREKDLIRLLVCRSYIDLPDICRAYKQFYGKSLADDVKSETSGDFRKLLMKIIGNN